MSVAKASISIAELPNQSSVSGPGWSRLFHTARYFRAGQILRRSASIVRRRLHADKPVERFGTLSPGLCLSRSDGLRQISERKLMRRIGNPLVPERAAEIRNGVWTFLGSSLAVGTPIDWKSPLIAGAPRLWQFNLHYHEWLLDLAADSSNTSAPTPPDIWRHLAEWLRAYSDCSERDAGDAWHPYCISRRLPAWLSLWSWHEPPKSDQEAILRSMTSQAAYLEQRLETDLGGNHLLENARALVLAGVALRNRDGDRWLHCSQRILDRELCEQILPHGEHFERSPMYHCAMIDVLEDVRDATLELDPKWSANCATAIDRMQSFVEGILHPDGEIPLLGDSCFGEAALARANGRSASSLWCSSDRAAKTIGDYWTYRAGGDYLLFDAGPVGPDHLPAHAHADLLNIEASFDGLRFVVDGGTHDYEDGAMRQYCRSTAAHNVLEIDGQNQCDVWSRFRMGRRGWPTKLITGVSSDGHWAQASHNAYRFLGVPVVGRWVNCSTYDWLVVDAAFGRGEHTLISRMHLHPEVRVTQVADAILRLEREATCRYLAIMGQAVLRVRSGWYCPRFGERIETAVVEAKLDPALPGTIGWQLTSEYSAHTARISVRGTTVVVGAPSASGMREFRITFHSGGKYVREGKRTRR